MNRMRLFWFEITITRLTRAASERKTNPSFMARHKSEQRCVTVILKRGGGGGRGAEDGAPFSQSGSRARLVSFRRSLSRKQTQGHGVQRCTPASRLISGQENMSALDRIINQVGFSWSLNIRNTVNSLFRADWIIKPARCLMEIHFDLLFSSFTSRPPSFYFKLLILSGSGIWPRHLPLRHDSQGERLCLAWLVMPQSYDLVQLQGCSQLNSQIYNISRRNGPSVRILSQHGIYFLSKQSLLTLFVSEVLSSIGRDLTTLSMHQSN